MSPVPGAERSQVQQDVPKIPLESLKDSRQIAVPIDEAPFQRRDSQTLHALEQRRKLLVTAGWTVLVLLALIAVNPAGGAWSEVPIVASLVLAAVFLLYQVIILSPWKRKFSSRHLDILAALWIWLLSFMLSFFTSPGRREVLANEEAWRMREDPGNSTAGMWIICVLLLTAFSMDFRFRDFLVLGQVVAFQHLLISATLPAGSRNDAPPSFGGVYLGLPPWLVPSIQLHGIALALAMVRLWQEEDKLVRAAVSEYLEGKEVPIGLAPGSGGPVKTRIELISEFLDREIEFLHELLRKVEDCSWSNRAHFDWIRSVDFLLDMLTSSVDVLKQTQINEEVEERDLQDQLSEWIGAGRQLTIQTVQSSRERDGNAPPNRELPGQIAPESPAGSLHSGGQLLSPTALVPPGEFSMQALQASSSISEAAEIPKELQTETSRSIHGVGDWSFDALTVATQHQSVLKMVGMEFLRDRALLPKEHIAAFLETLESRYDSNNPYHSNVHAADMTNAVYFMFENCGLQERTQISDSAVTCMYIAALGHDVGHPGCNNNFLVNSRHDIAITYSDRSVLEYFHAAELMRLLGGQVKGVNFLGTLTEQQQKQERFWMTSLILNTDMSKLMQDLSSLRIKIASGPLQIDDASEQQFVLSWLFRSADIGHAAKPWRIHEAWSMRVVQEFHAQGDNELRLNLPISPLCDRTDFRLGKSQAGFLQFVCLPTFAEITNLEEMLCEEDGGPRLQKGRSQGSGMGMLSPPMAKTRTERPSQLGGGHGRRKSMAQLASSKTRLEMCPSPVSQATPVVTPQNTARSPAPLPTPQTPDSTPRNPLSGRRQPAQSDGKVAPEPSEKRRGSLGSSTSGQRSLKITKKSTSSSLGSKRLTRVIKTRIYMQCKENMEIWQRMAADEEAALNAGASQSKGSSGHAVLSSSSNAGD